MARPRLRGGYFSVPSHPCEPQGTDHVFVRPSCLSYLVRTIHCNRLVIASSAFVVPCHVLSVPWFDPFHCSPTVLWCPRVGSEACYPARSYTWISTKSLIHTGCMIWGKSYMDVFFWCYICWNLSFKRSMIVIFQTGGPLLKDREEAIDGCEGARWISS